MGFKWQMWTNASAATVTASDNFNRTSNPISNPMSDGTSTWGAWGSFTGFRVDGSNAVGITAVTSNGMIVSSPSFPNDQSATATLIGVNSFFGPMVRIQGTSDTRAYQLQVNGNPSTLVLNKFVTNGSDVGTQIGSNITPTHGSGAAGILAVGDSITLKVVGTTLTVQVNGITETTQTDSAFSSGSPGLYIYDAAAIDSFSCTSIP